MLYVAQFSNWAGVSLGGVAQRVSAFGILRLQYPNAVLVPNLGYDLKIFDTQSGVNMYAPFDLNNPVYTMNAGSTFFVHSSKNSINANDYILGTNSGTVSIFFEVG